MRTTPVELTVNAPETALCFEGGGTRGAYTAGVVTTLIEHQIVFPWVGGISAGSSHTCNYASWDAARARESFVDLVGHPEFMGWRHFVRGRGYFNAAWIYEQSAVPEGPSPLDWDQMRRFPGQFKVGAFCADDGSEHYFGREDCPTLDSLMQRVRASSTMPMVMPEVHMDGRTWVDGALGPTGGFPIDAARADGYERLFVVMTQQRDFVKQPMRYDRAFRARFRRFPAVYEALMTRHLRYNQTREELFDLERDGKVLIFAPEYMPIGNSERRVPLLAQAYDLGLEQARHDVNRWKEWLGL